MLKDLQNALFCHSEEQSDEESLTIIITNLQYLSGLRFFALPLKQDRSE